MRDPFPSIADCSRAILSRRNALQLAAALPLAGFETRAQSSPAAPWSGTAKFDTQGRVLPYPGNTILCHLPQHGSDSGPFRAMLDLYRALPHQRFSRKLGILPPSSYHMTVFEGATDKGRDGAAWPADVPRNLLIGECTDVLLNRLKPFRSGMALPIRMRINTAERARHGRTLQVRLMPIDAAEENRLRALRDRLADLLALRMNGHETYEFHTTLAYRVAPMTEAEERDFAAFRTSAHQTLADRCPEIRLGPLEFCAFDDMFHFDQRLILR